MLYPAISDEDAVTFGRAMASRYGIEEAKRKIMSMYIGATAGVEDAPLDSPLGGAARVVTEGRATRATEQELKGAEYDR